MIRVLIADDHHLVRQGIRALLEAAADLEVVGEAGNGTEALALTESLHPDVLVVDITMPGLGGIEALERVVALREPARVVVLSMHDDETLIRRAMAGGAHGYVLKGSVADELILAIRAAFRGGTYLSERAGETIRSDTGNGDHDPVKSLTNREREVLGLIGEGLTNRAISRQLGVSVKTVERHRTSLMGKLDAHSVVELVRIGIRAGVIKLGD
ncbi:MAG TPA: response regulator transcription factor [Acidimicrobiia bacterium]|nr:response regulator transcription factor [Acidimicrobiia bacterium]